MPEPTYFLAIDQGTSSSRVILFDEWGRVVDKSQCRVERTRHAGGRVEQDPHQILSSIQQCLTEVLGQRNDRQHIQAAGMATQRSSVLAWNRKTGRALSPLLSWQDTRGRDLVESLSAAKTEIQLISGLPLTAHYGASKIAWLLEHDRSLQTNRDVCVGPLSAYLCQNLIDPIRPPVVDHANAGRTQLMDLRKRSWSPRLMELFGVPQQRLPAIVAIQCEFGPLRQYGIPVRVVQGDQTAAFLGAGHRPNNEALVNLGTGGFVLVDLPQLPLSQPTPDAASPLLVSIGDSSANHTSFVLEGTVNGAGSALDWARQTRQMPQVDGQQWKQWDQQVATVENPPLFLNTVGGLGSPFWCSPAPAPKWICKEGDPLGDAAALAAVVESIVFLVGANVAAIANERGKIESLRISGGLSGSRQIGQKLADLLQIDVRVCNDAEATARGIAWELAGRPVSWAQTTDSGDPDVHFRPRPNPQLYERYERLVGYFLDIA